MAQPLDLTDQAPSPDGQAVLHAPLRIWPLVLPGQREPPQSPAATRRHNTSLSVTSRLACASSLMTPSCVRKRSGTMTCTPAQQAKRPIAGRRSTRMRLTSIHVGQPCWTRTDEMATGSQCRQTRIQSATHLPPAATEQTDAVVLNLAENIIAWDMQRAGDRYTRGKRARLAQAPGSGGPQLK
jgi:hypothetical protein